VKKTARTRFLRSRDMWQKYQRWGLRNGCEEKNYEGTEKTELR
jgi:hypothetical protein